MSAMTDRIAEVSRRPAGFDVTAESISLAMGEPAEPTPSPIVTAAVSALNAGRTRYSPPTGSSSLRHRIASHLSVRHRRAFASESVVCTHGGSAGLAASVLAIVNPGDRVVIPEPTYSLYADLVAMAGGVTSWVANRPDSRIDVAAVVAALRDARMVILCNPSNPTGLLIDSDDLSIICETALRSGAYVLCDEAYSDIIFDGREFVSILDQPELQNLLACYTFSKSYAMTGWRLGYVVAEPPVAARINLIHRTFNGPLNTFVQDAGEVALARSAADLRLLSTSYQHRRDLVVAALEQVPSVRVTRPEGAFYAFVQLRDQLVGSDDLVARFALNGVLVRSGAEYGPSGEGGFRISFAAGVPELEVGLDRIAEVLRSLARV